MYIHSKSKEPIFVHILCRKKQLCKVVNNDFCINEIGLLILLLQKYAVNQVNRNVNEYN